MTSKGVYTSGGPVGGVGSTWHIDCVEGGMWVNNADECIDPLENFIDGVVVTLTILPTLNHSFVVSMDGEVASNEARVIEVAYQTFEANSFHPSNISLSMQGLPPWNEPPGPPLTQDHDGDSKTRAPIRERANVKQLNGERDRLTELGPSQEGEPPVQVWGNASVGRLRHVRMVMTCGKHGLQVGEVGAPTRNDQAGVKELAV